MAQISDEVFGVVQANGEPDEAVGDAALITLFCRNGLMRHLGRKAKEAFHATEALPQFEVLRGRNQLNSSFFVVR